MPCLDFPHQGEANKHPMDQIPQGRFHTTILGGLLKVAQKVRLPKVVRLRSKRLVSTFPIGAKRINTFGIKFHLVGLTPPFWVGFSKYRKSRIDEGRPIAFKTPCFDFPHRGEANKHPCDQIPPGRFHTTILGGLFKVAQKARLTKVVQLRSKRLVWT